MTLLEAKIIGVQNSSNLCSANDFIISSMPMPLISPVVMPILGLNAPVLMNIILRKDKYKLQ